MDSITVISPTTVAKNTTISICKNTRNHLASLGTKDSTFDEIIQKLLKKYDAKK